MLIPILANTILPVVLAILMFGLGLNLTIADFSKLIKWPKAILTALACQIIVMPAIAFGLAYVFALPGQLAVGLVLISSSPGGSTSSLLSRLFGGDVALNISLTAVNSLLALFTMPLVIGLGLSTFMHNGQLVIIPFDKIATVFSFVLGPALVGMIARHYVPALAAFLNKPMRYGAIVVIILLLLFIVATTWANATNKADALITFAAALILNILGLCLGYIIPYRLGISRQQAIASAFEIGIHNTTLSLFIALSVLKQPAIALAPDCMGCVCLLPPLALVL